MDGGTILTTNTMMPIGMCPGTLEPNAEVGSDDSETSIFNYPGSPDDIVLRSSDSYKFLDKFLLRELIQKVSNNPDVPDSEEQEPLLVVKLPESKATLYSLLTFIFPIPPILPSTTEDIMELLAVAQKYQMDAVMTHIRDAISRQDLPFLRPETALHIYLLAQQHGLRPEVLQAARVTLRLPMIIKDLGSKLDFSGMTGASLHELWKYHQQVRADLKLSVLEFRNSGLPDVVKCLRCSSRHTGVANSFPQWLDNYIKSIAGDIPLFDLIEFENTRARHIKFEIANTYYFPGCSCADISSQVIRIFWEALTAVVHGTIDKADSTLTLVEEEPTSENLDLPSVPLCLDIPDANIIVRSSDKVNFRVHKSVLAMSSPFFKDLLSLPLPPDDELVEGLPVIQLSKDSSLLNSLVSLLYPISPLIPGHFEKVFALLTACHKGVAGPESRTGRWEGGGSAVKA
ncbi:hypothetical protein EDB89DRAFT_2232052 [Lactarius sanguifluus]|nr:hypothetical protein EDB89DRAFT_2232052 [Lactarius sanguifluus]